MKKAQVPMSILDPSKDAVGLHYMAATPTTPPLRIYYPAADHDFVGNAPPQSRRREREPERRPIRWFQDTGVIPYLKGYAHLGLRHDTKIFQFLVKPFLYLLAVALPMCRMRIPAVYKSATPHQDGGKKLPLIVFSHGLTGTGQEHSVLCAAWAKRGYVVASVHHTDGSSCQVQMADGHRKYYEHGPPNSKYDASFRQNQVQVRAQELLRAYEFMTGQTPVSEDPTEAYPPLPIPLRDLVDPTRVIAAGYSYGAATVARAVVMDKTPFMAAVLLDGWFHVDVEKSAGLEFPIPREAFDYVEEHGSLPVPCFFLDSEQFQNFPSLYAATKKLAGEDVAVLAGTGHQNFCDVVFWAQPLSWYRRLSHGFLGTADPMDAYQEIIGQSGEFLDRVTKV